MCHLEMITEVFASLCFLLNIIALGSGYWLSSSNAHLGLWTGCHNTKCVMLGIRVPSYMQAARAFMLLAMFAGSISLFSISSIYFQCPFGCISKGRISAIFSTVAGLCNLIAVSSYTGSLEESDNMGWSLYVGWASVPLCLVTAGTALVLDTAMLE